MNKSTFNPRPIFERCGVSQREIAQALEVWEETVSRWVAGQVPSGENLMAMVSFLRSKDPSVEVDDLFSQSTAA